MGRIRLRRKGGYCRTKGRRGASTTASPSGKIEENCRRAVGRTGKAQNQTERGETIRTTFGNFIALCRLLFVSSI